MKPSRANRDVARTLLPLTTSLVVLLALDTPALSASLSASPSGFVPLATVAWRADPLTITVPASVDLGSAALGATVNALLGTVTVSDSRAGVPPWTATVSATSFTTGAGTPAQTITTADVSYWSGPATAASGGGSRAPGQATAAQKAALTAPVTAFTGRKAAVTTQTTSWQPTLVITVPASAVAGAYTGTVTHSVA
ncbi:hypothetical protein ACIBG4_19680 [Nonomuraea sp. NPDC050383]|uniref:hypothetical protein n=1 Tax=Nonomuraea sp. NPDC050383 TaxID=3364362 RepID=UPI0037918407